MNVPVTRRGGLHPPSHRLRLSIVGVASPLENRDWNRVEGRMQSAPTRSICSLSEITLFYCCARQINLSIIPNPL
jgi:hypothetical protein